MSMHRLVRNDCKAGGERKAGEGKKLPKIMRALKLGKTPRSGVALPKPPTVPCVEPP